MTLERFRLPQPELRLFLALVALACPAAGMGTAPAPAEPTRQGAVLMETYGQVRERLEKSAYGRPLFLDSREMPRLVQGDAYAVITQPYARVEVAMTPAGNWCEILLLPFNTKQCLPGEKSLAVFVGRKSDAPLENTFRINFEYAVTARSRDYFEVVLKAAEGPLGTHDYTIVLEATPIDEKRTFLHFRYSYGYGLLSKAAMSAYLATTGASKVGFTIDPGSSAGKLVGGMRGVMERNTMRYYLAIDAFLGTLDAPVQARVVQRLNNWFSATERYPRQLNEDIVRAQYLAMKEKEYARLASARRASAGT